MKTKYVISDKIRIEQLRDEIKKLQEEIKILKEQIKETK